MNRAEPGADRTPERPAPRLSAPSLALPKGGGAIRSIGEKFAVNAATGTASLTVPIPTSPGRGGFGPSLTLTYDSGSGNGPFGFGWTLPIPSITRKTDKGLPRYRDAEESDTYVLSGAEDLVPVLEPDGTRQQDDSSAPGFTIHRYRPRVEGLFARIERWTHRSTGEIHWRSISRDDVTTVYGEDQASRIADPTNPTRVFTWLVCSSYDDKGNAIVYEYVPEDDAGVDRSRANERNRVRTANRYLKRIRYGNRVSRLIEPDLGKASWLFEVVFDYDEGHRADLPLDPARAPSEQHALVRASPSAEGRWAVRPDPFSSYRSGFEVRTYRRCRRVLMFHAFPELNEGRAEELGDAPCLVRSVEFAYADLDRSRPVPIDAELAHPGSTRFGSFLQSVTQSGYLRDDTRPAVHRDGFTYPTYLERSLPPLTFEYARATVHDEVRDLDRSSLENLPAGVDGALYQWIDLDGEGAAGILTEQGGQAFYKPSLGGGTFAAARPFRTKPSSFPVAGGGTQLLDLSGDGQLDLVSLAGPTPGFHERTQDQGWESFQPFRTLPRLRWDDPNVRFVDLDGDGRADVLVTDDQCITWYPSLGEDGFGSPRQVPCPRDEERGPRLVLDDGTQSIYLADLSGDGLTDLVRIRNGEVSYWPNLGHGRFGAKVTMDDAPWFDSPDQFEQRRVRLADIDGSGTTDIVYLGRDGVRLYFNQSGNRWSEARRLPLLPLVEDVSSFTTADLLGNGTSCLVWSSALSADARRPLRWVDLMGGQKPHLLVRASNHLGADTRVEYAASTRFYFADERAGTPWLTRLPFPVQVVERVTTHDAISGNRFVTRYAYHHGYFDAVEREFRGFGMVEQRDTEEYASFAADAPPASTNVDPAFHVPPVLTKTWFHTGIYVGRDHVSDFFAGLLDETDVGEYYREPGATDEEVRAQLLPDTVMPAGLTPEEERQACRALKGMMLRQEVYALDAGDESGIPYTVTEQNFTLEPLQRRGGNRHAVFFPHAREAITHHYERTPSAPRVAHAITLEVNGFGEVLRSLAIAYGRRTPSTDPDLTDADRAKQATPLITYTRNSYAELDVSAAARSSGHHRAPPLAEARTYELTGFFPGAARFRFEDWARDGFAALESADDLDYELSPHPTKKQRRLVEHVRTLYRKDDLTGLAALGKVQSMALTGESYTLALTTSLIDHVFTRRRAGQDGERLLPDDPVPLLEGGASDQGGYVAWDGGLWVPSGRAFFDPAADAVDPSLTAATEGLRAREHFFTVRKMTDAFGQSMQIDYDDHDLLVTQTIDAVGNATSATNDYRVLQPREIADPNRNRTAVAFDALGMVVATARMGKDGEHLGDLLEGFDADPTLSDVQRFMADPAAASGSLLGRASTRVVYDLDRFRRTAQPTFAATLARETHFQAPGGASARIQIGFSYSDGFGREIQKKAPAAPGDAPERQPPLALPGGDAAPGALVRDAGGALVQGDASPRWIGSGRAVFNNKGKPVKQYEPFFSATHLFEPERELTDTGVSSVLFYDPLGRVVVTLHPNHTYEKVLFEPWRRATYDVNDTVAPAGAQTGDPRTDPDCGELVREYFQRQAAGWLTWYAARIGDALGTAERDAAQKSAAHADTPTVMHLDALGRAFLTVARNRYARGGTSVDEKYGTRVELDIEGNERLVRDAFDEGFDDQGNERVDTLGRIVVGYEYDLLNHRIHEASMEAGERWILCDAAGKPIRAWDTRGVQRRCAYDELRRPTALFVTEDGRERLAERTVYGESHGHAKNHRTRVFQRYDAAGVVTSLAYDFKGNLCESRRELIPARSSAEVDWQQHVLPDDGTFTSSATCDALDRPLTATSPDGSVHEPTFDEGGRLQRIDVRLRGAPAATSFVTDVEYDARGQRRRIDYGNGARTTYEHDPLTFRLTRLRTTRPTSADGTASQLFGDPTVVQDLRYSYDPAGNVTRIEDAAQVEVFQDGQRIDPACTYTYDAVYRLVEATGREHIGQSALDLAPGGAGYRDYPFAGHRAHSHDLRALRRYTERYQYDAAGNLLSFEHRAGGGGWTRRYQYEESSPLEPDQRSNRLTRTVLGDAPTWTEPYTYDGHGNTTSMAHLRSMAWSFKDELQQADLGGGGTARYVYDSAGQRVRKVIESQAGVRQSERLYLGAFEIHREFAGDGVSVSLERESLHVQDDEQRVALVDTQTIDAGTSVDAPSPLARYQLEDHLGSASVELDGAGALVSYEEFHPYGTTSFQAGRSAAEVSSRRYRYTSKERDEETGLYYHGTRYRSPWSGRWVSADRGLIDGTNLYAYVRNNPVRYHDETGAHCDPAKQSCVDPTRADQDRGAGPSQNGAALSAVGRVAVRNNPTGPTLAVADNFDDAKIAAYKQRITDPTDRAIGIRSVPPGKKSATADLRAANEDLRNAFNESLEPGQRAAAGVRDIDHTVELQNIIRKGAPGADTVRPQDHRVQNSRLNSSQGSANQKIVTKQLNEKFPVDTPAGGVARARDVNKFWNTQQFRTVARSVGHAAAVGGAALSAYQFSQDVSEGNWTSAAMSGSGFAGGALAVGGSAAGSTTLVAAGTAIGAPAAVVGAGAAGWALGTYTNENTAISDVAMAGGSLVERATGSSTLGAVGAAATAVTLAPVFVPIAVATGAGRGAAWLWNKVF